MQKTYIDFWNTNSILAGLSHIYGVPKAEIMDLVVRYPEQEELLSAFFERYEIHPDTYELNNIYIRCKLIGKYPDKSMLESDGLMSLVELLDRENSFLVTFLRLNDIHIDVDNKVFRFRNNAVPINENSNLGVKLYHDHGEIEAFYCADERTMLGYSCVKQHPEILSTIEDFVRKNFRVNMGLGEGWSNLISGFDVISFDVCLGDTTFIGGYSDDWHETWPYDDYYEEEYPYTDSYPRLLFMNLWLLKYAFGRLQGEMYDELFIGINHRVVIPYDELTIEHFED